MRSLSSSLGSSTSDSWSMPISRTACQVWRRPDKRTHNLEPQFESRRQTDKESVLRVVGILSPLLVVLLRHRQFSRRRRGCRRWVLRPASPRRQVSLNSDDALLLGAWKWIVGSSHFSCERRALYAFDGSFETTSASSATNAQRPQAAAEGCVAATRGPSGRRQSRRMESLHPDALR